ncbi:MAG: hypothetical protein AAF587_01825 [Bacteroidota bacterium]
MKKLNLIVSFAYLTSLLLLLVTLFVFPPTVFGQNAYSDFWKDQVDVFSLEGDPEFSSFNMLKELVGEYQFFFTAEEHWQAMNPKIQFRFLTFLHKYAGVRNLILEGGYAYGELLNRYLDTGNEKLLIRALYDTPVCPRDQMTFYRDLYQFNQSVPESDRIWLVGIDLEQSPLLVTECLYRMLPNKPLTAGVRKKITQLKTLHEQEGYNDKEARRFYRQWYKEWQERKRAYRRYWEEEYWLFEMILENLVQGFDIPVLREFVYAHGDDKKRELRMYNNFKLLNKHGRLKAGKFYGQFGGIHTEIKPAINWGFPTLAQNLNAHSYSPVQGKVLTISKYFRRVPRVYEKFKEFDEFMEVMAEVDAFYEEDIVLFRLIGNEEMFPNLSKNFQFILIVPEDMEAQPCR